MNADESENLINKGWKFIGVLPNSKVVVERVNYIAEVR